MKGVLLHKILKILLIVFCDIFRSPREKYIEQEKSGLKINKTIVSSRKYSSKPYFPLGWKTNGRVQVNSRFCVLHNYQLEQYRTHHNTCNTWMVLTVQARSIFTIASIIGSILTWIVGSAAVMEELSSPSVGSPRRCRLNMGGDCGAGSPGGDVIEYPYVNTPTSKVNSTSGAQLVLFWYSTSGNNMSTLQSQLYFWYSGCTYWYSSGSLLLAPTCQHSKFNFWYYIGTLLLVPTSHMPTLQRQLYFWLYTKSYAVTGVGAKICILVKIVHHGPVKMSWSK